MEKVKKEKKSIIWRNKFIWDGTSNTMISIERNWMKNFGNIITKIKKITLMNLATIVIEKKNGESQLIFFLSVWRHFHLKTSLKYIKIIIIDFVSISLFFFFIFFLGQKVKEVMDCPFLSWGWIKNFFF